MLFVSEEKWLLMPSKLLQDFFFFVPLFLKQREVTSADPCVCNIRACVIHTLEIWLGERKKEICQSQQKSYGGTALRYFFHPSCQCGSKADKGAVRGIRGGESVDEGDDGVGGGYKSENVGIEEW